MSLLWLFIDVVLLLLVVIRKICCLWWQVVFLRAEAPFYIGRKVDKDRCGSPQWPGWDHKGASALIVVGGLIRGAWPLIMDQPGFEPGTSRTPSGHSSS